MLVINFAVLIVFTSPFFSNIYFAAISSNTIKLEDSSSDGKRLKSSVVDRNTRASKRKKVKEVREKNCKTGPDVADAIEDLLAQSDKVRNCNVI